MAKLPDEKKNLFHTYWITLVTALYTLIYLKNYWLAEDSYINFRSLEQLWSGNGPVWNIGERVQVYTSALWYWLIAGCRLLINDLYWATFSCSFILYLLIITKIFNQFKQHIALATAFILLLLTSNSFMDFSASGLENILLYFLLLHFLCIAISEGPKKTPPLAIYLLCSLLLLARHDQLIFLLPFLATIFLHDFIEHGVKNSSKRLMIGMLPFIIWTIFSIIYYGFPFPNTAYAKLNTGIPKIELLTQGIEYFYISFAYDHLLPIVLFLGIAAGLFNSQLRPFAIGVILNLCYIAYVGGDYMRGRFFSHLYLICLFMLIYSLKEMKRPIRYSGIYIIFIGCLWWNYKAPFTPITSDLRFSDHIKIHETANERGIFYRSTSILSFAISLATDRPFPDWPFYVDGQALQHTQKPWVYITNIGMTGYAAGLKLHIFDRLALADPLMARLPAIPGPWAPGHFVRDMPWGYAEANLDGISHIYDQDLDQYYQTLRLITRSPKIFTSERLKAIWRANFSTQFANLRTSHIERWSQRGCKICKGENNPLPNDFNN